MLASGWACSPGHLLLHWLEPVAAGLAGGLGLLLRKLQPAGVPTLRGAGWTRFSGVLLPGYLPLSSVAAYQLPRSVDPSALPSLYVQAGGGG